MIRVKHTKEDITFIGMAQEIESVLQSLGHHTYALHSTLDFSNETKSILVLYKKQKSIGLELAVCRLADNYLDVRDELLEAAAVLLGKELIPYQIWFKAYKLLSSVGE